MAWRGKHCLVLKHMKRFLAILLLCWSWSVWAQPILRNSFTTNSVGRTPNVLPTSTNTIYPLMVLNPDGSGGDRQILFNAALTVTGTNASIGGDLFVTNIFVTTVNATTVKINGKDASVTSVNGTNITPLNLTNTATVTWAFDGTSNVTATATSSGGSGVTTVVTPLAYSGTNITGFNCTTNNATFTLTLTNHCLFGTSTFVDLPNTTTNHFFTLALKQDSAGTWVPKFTNSIVAWADGVQPVVKTNANAVSYLYFHSHLFTNGMLSGSANINVQ